MKKHDEVEEKAHHIFKKQKIAVTKKQNKRVDRIINKAIQHRDPRALYNEYELENYA